MSDQNKPPLVRLWTDADIRKLWREAGGDFHGPHVEHAYMTEAKFLPFMHNLLSAPALPPDVDGLVKRLTAWKEGGVLSEYDLEDVRKASAAILQAPKAARRKALLQAMGVARKFDTRDGDIIVDHIRALISEEGTTP